ncbi:amidohydrolase family protein [Streptomyces sp. NPDC048491]|uniref:amidohydrolase family protein n=1 Tax=unclassified Streptomyces TaxID=2593676 RepID=UPI000C279D19|nr:amidohydrolase family protein [Streptomyces sp. CB01201]MBX7469100.1 amidohydrolase [Streptomyces sp. MAG02]PJN03865.1 amidohydrolase [Streptomyces sp. CB01201]
MASSESGSKEIPRVISVDDHVIEPAHLFETWLPSKYRDRGPKPFTAGIGELAYIGGKYKFTTDPEGQITDWWDYEGQIFPYKRIIAAVGFSRDEMTLDGITREQMRRGCWDPKARLADMDLNHVEASLCFPTFPRFCGQTFAEAEDKEVALACVRAYNDWMVEEWCGDSGGRLIPLCLIPLWDIDLAVAEIRRNAARGVRAVTFSEIPTYLGLPSIHSGYWDPFFAACEETGTVVNMHIGSSSQMPAASPDAPPAVQASLSFNNAMASMMDFLFSGVLVKFPRLKLAYSEGQMGWIPYALERADDVWEEHRAWGGVKDLIPEPPSTYYYRQIFCCFFRDKHGIEAIETVGVNNATFETDYPHVDSTWPHTKQVATEHVGGLSPDVAYKLLRGNAIRMLDLPFDQDLGRAAGR